MIRNIISIVTSVEKIMSVEVFKIHDLKNNVFSYWKSFLNLSSPIIISKKREKHKKHRKHRKILEFYGNILWFQMKSFYL